MRFRDEVTQYLIGAVIVAMLVAIVLILVRARSGALYQP